MLQKLINKKIEFTPEKFQAIKNIKDTIFNY